MTQPTLPSAEAQKQAAAEVFAQYEPPLYEAYLEMMLEWLAAVKAAMFAGGVASLGLVPDPMKVFSQTPKWHTLTSKYSEQVARDALAAPYRDLFANGTLFESRPFVRNWIAARENRLNAVPDEVFGAVAQVIDSATTNGASIPDVQAQIEKLFDATDTAKWKNRARTVARTEVVGAYNGGLYDAFSMLVANDPETVYVKRWLATEDHRTRPDHVEADGQVVPWGQPFTVGGFAMQYPHDPEGPPQEVINCVIGSTQVAWPRQALHGTTRRYHPGPFVQVVTADGHNLTVTPNHPVLTPDGYVPAGLLRKGQHVMGTVDAEAPEVSNRPSSAEEVHSSLGQPGMTQRVVGSRMDFHGDGIANEEVEVVRANGHLPTRPNPSGRRDLQEEILVGLDHREVPLSDLGGAVVLWLPVEDSRVPGRFAPSLVSRLGQRPPLADGQAAHAEPVRFAAGADFEAQLNETPDQGRTAESDFPTHLQYALAVGMTPTEVIEVNRLADGQFVYNLSTSDHWFTGNGIALHNCRCTLLLEIENEPTEMGNRQYKDALAAAGLPVAMSLMQYVCDDGKFCMQTHKPGLCKGQKRGQQEPGAVDATKQNPAVKAQVAVQGLSQAIAQAQAVAVANAVTNPKLAAMAKKAVAGYQRALAPHQQTLKDAARANDSAKRTGARDTGEQDRLDRKKANAEKRAARKAGSLKKHADTILARRAEKAKLAKMSPKQRSAYHKAKAAKAKAQREARENQVLKQAGKG